MLSQDRQRYIVTKLKADASVSTVELARALHVSTETIRRDLTLLQDKGALQRVYGGAVIAGYRRQEEPPHMVRLATAVEGKRKIGEIAALLARSDHTVFVDVGTTGQFIARELAVSYRGTVVTNSLLVANELADSTRIEVIIAPGRLRPGKWSSSGAVTVQFLGSMRFDTAFISCGAIDAKAGITVFDFEDTEAKPVVCERSTRVLIVADSTKHGVVGRHAVVDWNEVQGLVTDKPPPPGLTTRIEATGGIVYDSLASVR
ncbi:MAG: DeoR/GlpR family DNA-binding transcription regulator [Brooklawnia sp.]|jgi:DeoR family fructose operon transcriptional repressor